MLSQLLYEVASLCLHINFSTFSLSLSFSLLFGFKDTICDLNTHKASLQHQNDK
ncbi:hypothetical protein EXN66_Car001232 [Channa argus]|uniref:Uncharacterized protein n=1 Tax=Channa argus TaxID=215402 RepID=A0A6G1R0J6_CHAAH|nr:hypothetical protein EXN66_Car001232 [Channa argus]